MKFKIGDRVRLLKASVCCSERVGMEGTIVSTTHSYREWPILVKWSDGEHHSDSESNWELVRNKPNQSLMTNLINKVRELARKEPEKSLIAKGITDTNDVLTSEGRELFLDYLYRTKKTEFVADPEIAALLAEQEK